MDDLTALLASIPDVVWGTLLGSSISLATTYMGLANQRKGERLQLKRQVFMSAADYATERISSLAQMLTYEDGGFKTSTFDSSGTAMRVALVASPTALRAASKLDTLLTDVQMTLFAKQVKLLPLMKERDSIQEWISRRQEERRRIVHQLEDVLKGVTPAGPVVPYLQQRQRELEQEVANDINAVDDLNAKITPIHLSMFDDLLNGLGRYLDSYAEAITAIRADVGIDTDARAIDSQMRADFAHQRERFDAIRAQIAAARAGAQRPNE